MFTQANQGDSGKQVDHQLLKYREEKERKWKESQMGTKEEQKQSRQQQIPQRQNVIPQSQSQQKLQQQKDTNQLQEKMESQTTYEVPKQQLQPSKQPINQQNRQQDHSRSEYIKEESKNQGKMVKCFTCDLQIRADQEYQHMQLHKAKKLAKPQKNVVQVQKAQNQKIIQREKALINLSKCNICDLGGEVTFIKNHMKTHLNEQLIQPALQLSPNPSLMNPSSQQAYQHQQLQVQKFQSPQSYQQQPFPQNKISMSQNIQQPIIKSISSNSYQFPQNQSMIQQSFQRQQGAGNYIMPQQQQNKTQIYPQQQAQHRQNVMSNPQIQQTNQPQQQQCDVCKQMIQKDKFQQHFLSHSNEEQKNPINTTEQLLNAYQNNVIQNFQNLQDQAVQSFQQTSGQFLNQNTFENQIQANYTRNQPSNQQTFYYQQPYPNNDHQFPQSTYQPKKDIQYPSNISPYNYNKQQQVQQSQVPWPQNQNIPSKQSIFQQRNSQPNTNVQANRIVTLGQLNQIKAQPQTALQQSQALRFQAQYQQQANQQQPLSEFCDQCQQYIFKQMFEEHQKFHAINQIQQQERRLAAQQERQDFLRQFNLGSQMNSQGRGGPFGPHNYEVSYIKHSFYLVPYTS